jgi:hypothetical protein
VGYSEDMDDAGKGKMINNAPTKGDMGCVWPKESRSPTVTTKNVMTENKGVCTIINNK